MQQTPKPVKKNRCGFCGVMLAVVVIALISGVVASHSSTSPNPDRAAATVRSDQLMATINARQTAGAVEMGQFAAAQTAEASSPLTPPPQPTRQAIPTPTPRPTRPPTCQAINNNAWCDNFSLGNLSYNPPSNFCDYFTCLAGFWGSDDPGDGYVVECADGTFSQSGGERGACSSHGACPSRCILISSRGASSLSRSTITCVLSRSQESPVASASHAPWPVMVDTLPFLKTLCNDIWLNP